MKMSHFNYFFNIISCLLKSNNIEGNVCRSVSDLTSVDAKYSSG